MTADIKPLKFPEPEAEDMRMGRGGRRENAGRPREGYLKKKMIRLPSDIHEALAAEAAARGAAKTGRNRVLRSAIEFDQRDPAEALKDPGAGSSMMYYFITQDQHDHVAARAEAEGLSFAATLRAILSLRRW